MRFSDLTSISGGMSIPVGIDESETPVLFDFEKSSHLLISGATGTGKSVIVDNILLALISHNKPEQLKMILCDTKMIEFAAYNGIPHLMIPVCTSPDKISGALAFADYEISKRLYAFASAGQKDLSKYNDYMWVNFLNDAGIPRIIIVVDDLSETVSNPETAQYIRKILQNGRAAGVHLIAVTQTPTCKSAKEISLMIRPKIALSFASKSEESALIGTKKDFLIDEIGFGVFSPCGIPQKVKIIPRLDSDRDSIIRAAKNLCSENCKRESPESPAPSPQLQKGREPVQDCAIDEDMFAEAVDVVIETSQASVSMLQRRLKIGYSKAARLIDRMEEIGYVGPFEGTKPRMLLLTKSQWQSIKSGKEFTAPNPSQKQAKGTNIKENIRNEKENRKNQSKLHRILFGRKRME